MDRGLLFAGGGLSIKEAALIGVEAERVGFHALYCVEAYRSGLVPLAALAAATSEIRVGTYVLNAHFRPPVAAAMAARDIDELSEGRTILGVGSGNAHINSHYLGASNAKPLQFMREYLRGLRLSMGAAPGEPVEFQHVGQSVKWTPSLPAARTQIPVLLAAMFPKMRRVAAAEADGIALGSLHSAEYVAEVVRPAVEDELVKRNRDPSKFRIVASTLASVGRNTEAARLDARKALCRLFTPLPHPYYEFVLREQGLSLMVDAISREMELGREDAAVEAIGDDVVDRVMIAGDVEDCNALLSRYDEVLDEIVLADASSVGASLRPGSGSSAKSLRALLALAPQHSLTSPDVI